MKSMEYQMGHHNGGAFAVVVGLADKIHFLEWKYLSFDSDISEITPWKY